MLVLTLILQLRKQPFNLPPPLISSQDSPVLRFLFLLPVRCEGVGGGEVIAHAPCGGGDARHRCAGLVAKRRRMARVPVGRQGHFDRTGCRYAPADRPSGIQDCYQSPS